MKRLSQGNLALVVEAKVQVLEEVKMWISGQALGVLLELKRFIEEEICYRERRG